MFFIVTHLWFLSRDQNMYREGVADDKSCRGSVEKVIPQDKTHRTAMRKHIWDILIGLLGLLASIGVVGNLHVTGIEKALCSVDKQSMYSGVTLKDPFLRGMLWLSSGGVWVFLVLIPLSGVYWACIGIIFVVCMYFGHTSVASYIDHLMGVHNCLFWPHASRTPA